LRALHRILFRCAALIGAAVEPALGGVALMEEHLERGHLAIDGVTARVTQIDCLGVVEIAACEEAADEAQKTDEEG
jgi:hypothetical protein